MSDPTVTDEHSSRDWREEHDARELQQSVRGGARMVAVSQVASQSAALIILSCLYRLLGGEPFGLLGMAAPLLALAEMLGAFGFPIAAVQRARMNQEELSALFWWNVAFSLMAAVLIAVLAAPLASLFAAPQLAAFAAALALAPLVSSLVRLHRALLERRLKFGKLAALRLAAQATAGGLAVWAAAAGWGAWSLIVQIYADQLVFAAVLWIWEPWRPGRFQLAGEHRELLKFSGLYSVSSLLFFLSQHADRFLLSLSLGSTSAGQQAIGFYSQAFGLMSRPLNQIITPVTALMLPALSRAQGEPRLALCRDFYRAVAVMLLPAGAGLTAVGGDVMWVMGGPTWAPAGRLLQILAPVLMVQGLIAICGSVYAASGRTDALARAAAAYALVLIAAVGCGAWLRPGDPPLLTAERVAWAVMLAHLVLAPPYIAACLATAGVRVAAVARSLAPAAAAALAMGALVFAARQALIWGAVAPAWRVAALIPAGAAIYWLLAPGEASWLLRRWILAPQRTATAAPRQQAPRQADPQRGGEDQATSSFTQGD